MTMPKGWKLSKAEEKRLKRMNEEHERALRKARFGYRQFDAKRAIGYILLYLGIALSILAWLNANPVQSVFMLLIVVTGILLIAGNRRNNGSDDIALLIFWLITIPLTALFAFINLYDGNLANDGIAWALFGYSMAALGALMLIAWTKGTQSDNWMIGTGLLARRRR